MLGSLHQGLIALLCARPELAQRLWCCAEPDAERYAGLYARVQDNDTRIQHFGDVPDAHRWPDAVVTLHATPTSIAVCVLVAEFQFAVDLEKFFTWIEYIGSARRRYRTWGRLIVLSPVDAVIAWARRMFANEPRMQPELIGRKEMPRITDVDQAILNPELAVLSAVFHGPHAGGAVIVTAAAFALRTLPLHKRKEYFMMLADALPEAMVEEIRDITFEEAQAAADEWLRTRYTYVKGHREGLQDGLQEGRQEGRQAGLLAGRLEALADILELRGLIPTPEEQATIVGTDDAELVHRWCARAKHAATVAELFDALDQA